VKNIYEETAERAHGLARRIDVPQAQAGVPERRRHAYIASLPAWSAIGMPAVSAPGDDVERAARRRGLRAVPGFGRLLAERR